MAIVPAERAQAGYALASDEGEAFWLLGMLETVKIGRDDTAGQYGMLEEAPDGLPMNELAERILYSKSGFTRVVDRMEEAGLVRRVRPEHDRRSILVLLTEEGTKTMERARLHHRDGIDRHFSRHLTDAEVRALTKALEKVSSHARPLRPGRISG